MVELRKRPARVEPEEPRATKKSSTPAAKTKADKAIQEKKETANASDSVKKGTEETDQEPEPEAQDEHKTLKTTEKSTAPSEASAPAKSTKTAASGGSLSKGDHIDLDSFGGEVETHDGKKVTLKQLVEESKSGVGKSMSNMILLSYFLIVLQCSSHTRKQAHLDVLHRHVPFVMVMTP